MVSKVSIPRNLLNLVAGINSGTHIECESQNRSLSYVPLLLLSPFQSNHQGLACTLSLLSPNYWILNPMDIFKSKIVYPNNGRIQKQLNKGLFTKIEPGWRKKIKNKASVFAKKGRTIMILKPKADRKEATSDPEGKSCKGRKKRSFNWMILKGPKNNTLALLSLHFDVSVELSTERARKPNQCGSHGWISNGPENDKDWTDWMAIHIKFPAQFPYHPTKCFFLLVHHPEA